jgi:C-terminal processing protease CtpA/Prc
MKKIVQIYILFFSISGLAANSENEDYKKKMETIGNLYGYARYFNPNLETNKWKQIDWYKFLMFTIRESEKIANNEDSICNFLYNSFYPIFTEMQLSVNNKIIVTENKSPKNKKSKIYLWMHKGFGSQGFGGYGNPFKSKLLHTNHTPEMPVPDSLYSYPINNNITLFYPIAVTAQNTRKNKELAFLKSKIDTIDLRLSVYSFLKIYFKKEMGYSPFLNQDQILWMADFIEHWNIVKHFYPYLKEEGFTDNKMNDFLVKYIGRVGKSKTLLEYKYVLKEFFGNFKDDHISVNGTISAGSKFVARDLFENTPACLFDYIEGQIVSAIGQYTEQGDTIMPGDKLINVNDIPIDTLIASKLKYIPSATAQGKMQRFVRDGFLSYNQDSLFVFKFINTKGKIIEFTKNISDQTFSGAFIPFKANSDFINELAEGIYYIRLASPDFDEKKFKKFVTKTATIKALIFELREYPHHDALELLGYLSESPVIWGDYRIPIRYYPNQEKEIWKKGNETIKPKTPYLNAPRYALIDENTISYGESLANTIKKNQLATLVGSNTSGTNGDLSRINTPMFDFYMSIGKDFDNYHAKGIVPDIVVTQTLDDYQKGVDSILELIINEINK